MNFCNQCGAQNAENANFCARCGHEIHSESVGNTPVSRNQHTPDSSPVYAILGWVFSGISILFIPILFAAGGVIFGYLHRKVNHTHGTIIMIAAIACGLFGTILGAASVNYDYYY